VSDDTLEHTGYFGLVIGARHRRSIVIAHAQISRTYCRACLDGHNIVVTILHSTNETLAHAELAEHSFNAQIGSPLRIVRHVLRHEYGRGRAAPADQTSWLCETAAHLKPAPIRIEIDHANRQNQDQEIVTGDCVRSLTEELDQMRRD
jgi:hypothetical protein